MPAIFFISPSAYIFGGLATWLDYLVPGLEKGGWGVTVGLTKGQHHDVGAYILKHPFKKVIAVENKTGTSEGRIRSICGAINKIKPDLVVSVNIPDTYLAVERLRRIKRAFPKVIMTVHGIQPNFYGDIKRYRDVLDAVVCTNKLACFLAEVDGGIEKQRVYYAPYGVSIVNRVITQNNDGPLRIVYSGRLEQNQKRIHDIPLVLEKLEEEKMDYRFTFVGDGPEEKALKDRLSNQVRSGKVRFLGVLSPEDIKTHVYEHGDVLLLTSLWETGPIVIWEAMANGLVVVSSAYIGSGLEGSLVNGKNCFLFPVGDVKAAAACLVQAKNLDVRRKLSGNGHRFILEKYSQCASIKIWSDSFTAILSKPTKNSSLCRIEIAKAGRLDRIFGTLIAENLREMSSLSFKHSEPGGEWPHTHSARNIDDRGFWEKARILDAREIPKIIKIGQSPESEN